MLTGQQEMTPLLRRLKRRIASDGDFRCFVEKVGAEEAIKGFCAGAGLDCCELLRAWAAGTPSPQMPPPRRMPPPMVPQPPKRMPPPTGDDDDGEDDSEPVMPDHPDEDDDTTQETKICPVCNGRGRTHDGLTCDVCNGSGRARIDREDDDEDED
jgi:hypothetical protein